MRRLLFLCVMFAGGVSAETRPLTLSEAVQLAETTNPALRSARAALAGAEGAVQESRGLLHNNPQITLDNARRSQPRDDANASSFRESSVGISQTFEIAGQHGLRRNASERELDAARADVEAIRLRVRSEVEQGFFLVLVLQQRLEAERRSSELASEVASAVDKRVAAGEDTRLDGNLARVEAERARNQASTTFELLIDARARLAAVLQLPPADFPTVSGELFSSMIYNLRSLLASSSKSAQMIALARREEAARDRLSLERASAFPDVTVSLASGREGPPDLRERVTTLSVSVPLPLFRRNQAGIGRALTDLDRASIERESATRDAEARVRSLWARLGSLESRARRFAENVLPSLDENLSLSTKAYRAGEIGILQLITVNRQVLDARRDFLDAVSEFHNVRFALEAAAGYTP